MRNHRNDAVNDDHNLTLNPETEGNRGLHAPALLARGWHAVVDFVIGSPVPEPQHGDADQGHRGGSTRSSVEPDALLRAPTPTEFIRLS